MKEREEQLGRASSRPRRHQAEDVFQSTEGWKLSKPAKFHTSITTIRTCASGTICSARSLLSSSSSDVTEPISLQPQQCFSGMNLSVAELVVKNVGLPSIDIPATSLSPLCRATASLPFLTPAVYLFGILSSLGRHKHESPITLPPVPNGETEQESAMDLLHDHHDQHDDDAEAEAEGNLSSACPRDLPHFVTLGHHSSVHHFGHSSSSKSLKQKQSFGKNNTNAAAGTKSLLAAQDGFSAPEVPSSGSKQISATVSNITNLLMSLNTPPVPSSILPHTPAPHPAERDCERDFGSFGEYNDTARGSPERCYGGPNGSTGDKRSEHGISLFSTQSRQPLVSSATSIVSSIWRSSMSRV
ncbi:hypothetical protein BD311DRAFT_792631 [Dichomitus squalens]|uniref:Uncharacterized protein n=1 Tax=Dichomitus squalens TaxID=114155 RepID=A0A4Q9M3Z7_9APHY|nr:hypothetical protein BD311DRAFT_792631 [Dichomitus squalens]